MAFPNNPVEEIKNRLDIVSVIEKYVKLKPTGKNHIGLCPFHSEKTPSFIVSPDLQRYKCFGCSESGDIFNFVQKVENIDFPEALEKLAKDAGVEIKKQDGFSKYKILEEINYKATKYYYNKLKESQTAQEYLEERGFSKESLKNFGIGYAPQKPKLREYLLNSKNYSQRQLLDSGLFTLKDSLIKEKFYDRIMFPIRSSRGKVLGFTGRVLPGNDWGPKYMNSPDTPLFHKKENLFGQYESRQEIRKVDLAIICEGSTDVVSAHQHGIKNIVAPLGTGLTKEQLINLSKMTKNLLFFFDSDSAGQNALLRGFKLASELGLIPYATNAQPYKDIDELLQKKPSMMKKKIKKKNEAYSFILSHFLQDLDLNRLEDISRVKNFIGPLLGSVRDDTAKNLYIQKTFALTKLDLFNKAFGPTREKGRDNANGNFPMKRADNKIYREYLQLLLLLDNIDEKFLVKKEHFHPSNELESLYLELLKHYKEGKEQLYSKLHDNETVREIFEEIVFNLTEIPTEKHLIEEDLKKIMRRITTSFLREQQKDLSRKVAVAEEKGNSEDAETYLKELIKINNILQNQ
jgi:DNA primase